MVYKIISSKIGFQERTFFGRKYFMVAKSFPQKQVYKKKKLRKIFWSKMFYGCKVISSKTGLQKKILTNFLVENILWF